MKHIPAVIGAALVATLLVLVEAPWSARAQPTSHHAVAAIVPLPSAQPVPDIEVRAAAEIAELARRQPQRDWLVEAMMSWTKPPQGLAERDAFERNHRESTEAFVSRLEDVAAAVDASKASGTLRAELDIVALAFEESGFRRWVADGSCNTTLGYPPPPGEWSCDGGKAFTVWQLRPDLWWTPAGEDPVDGADLLADPQLAADKAWEKYHANPAGWSTWPRAKALAERWAAAHPVPVDASAVTP